MTQWVARGDRRRALEVFQSLVTLVAVTATIAFIAAAAVILSIPLHRWFHLQLIPLWNARLILILLLAEVLTALTNGINRAGFVANGDYALYAFLFSSTMLSQFVALWLVAATGYGPVIGAGAFVLMRILGTFLSGVLLLRRHRWLAYGFRNARTAELRRLIRPSAANFMMPLAQAFSIQGMLLVIGAVLGPLAVVAFSTLRTLTRVVFGLVSTISNAVEPEYASAFGARQLDLLRRLYVQSMRASLWLALAGALALLFAGRWIFAVWTHSKVALDQELFYWLLISPVIAALWSSALTTIRAANLHLRAASLYCASSLLSVSVAVFLLMHTRALADAGLALLLVDILMALYTVWAASRFVKVPVRSCLAGVLNPLPLIHPGK